MHGYLSRIAPLLTHIQMQHVSFADLNSDPNSSAGPHLSGLANQNHLTIHVRESSRKIETAATILDQFLSNIPFQDVLICVLPPLSDNDYCTIGEKILFKSVKNFWALYEQRISLYNMAKNEGPLPQMLSSLADGTCVGDLQYLLGPLAWFVTKSITRGHTRRLERSGKETLAPSAGRFNIFNGRSRLWWL